MSTFQESTPAKVALGLSLTALCGFGVYCIVYAKYFMKKDNIQEDCEEFITARGSSTKWLIAWSFFASAVGSWVIAAVADYAYWAGIIGAIFYAIAAGLPIIFVALWGQSIRESFPDVLSLSDFARKRFGAWTQIYVMLLSIFNMSIATAAEYTTVYSLFDVFVGIENYAVIVVIVEACVALSYTTYGGLRISIITDRIQAIMAVLFIAVIAMYMAIKWRMPHPNAVNYGTDADPQVNTDLRDQLLGKTTMGYSSILTMPLSLTCATIFSEAMWQRVWASESKESLHKGAGMAFIMIFLVIFFFGIIGILGGWAGYTNEDSNPNIRVFLTVSPSSNDMVNSGIGVMILVLAVTMSESAVDSLQNAIGASVTGAIAKYIKEQNTLMISRLVVVLFNAPLIVIGCLNLQVLSLFLVGNMLCTSAAVPIMVGFSKHPQMIRLNTDFVPPVSFFLTVIGISLYGMIQMRKDTPDATFLDGIAMAFYNNQYSWDYTLTAFLLSAGTTALLMGINFVRFKFRHGAGVSEAARVQVSDEIPSSLQQRRSTAHSADMI